jgi:hypothetical protein
VLSRLALDVGQSFLLTKCLHFSRRFVSAVQKQATRALLGSIVETVLQPSSLGPSVQAGPDTSSSFPPITLLVKLAPARVENESGCWQGPGAWGGRAGPQLSLCSCCETSVYTTHIVKRLY